MSDEDDYMTMSFGDDAATTGKKRKPVETSLQRRIRLQREGRERGYMPSKAELAKSAEEEREAALSRSLFAQPGPGSTPSSGKPGAWPPSSSSGPPKPVNKGFAMMAKMGFVAGQSLGKKRAADEGADARASNDGNDGKARDDKIAENKSQAGEERPMTEPIRIQVKRDRAGIGAVDKEKKERDAQEAREAAEADAKRASLADMDPYEYRDRIRQEREAERLERQIHAAQVMAERMACEGAADDDDGSDGKEPEDKALADINVLWRGMVKVRRDRERSRALHIKNQQRLDSRLRSLGTAAAIGSSSSGSKTAAADGASDGDDSDEDNDDRLARGKRPAKSFLDSGMTTVVADEDEEAGSSGEEGEARVDVDDELAEFDALSAKERLQQVVDWMRQNRRYCFWCKFKYPDNDLDGCPGPTEEDHD